jgi:GNAT superfamily N-acetyltransferase
MIRILDTSEFEELKYPEELEGSWFYYVFFKNHKTLGGIVCVYFNDKYPSGSVCVGDYILNDYPDIYGTWKIDDEFGNILSDRLSVSPILRNKGIGKTALFYGAQALKYLFNKNFTHAYGSKAGNRLYSSAFGVDNVKDTPVEETIDLRDQFFDQPAYPYIFFGKRVVK